MKFEESLNKGVPTNIAVALRIKDLADIVSDKESLQAIIEKYFSKYMSFLNSLGCSSDIEYFQTLSVITDEETLEKKIIFAVNGFYNTILINLNVDNNINSYKFQKEGQKNYKEPYESFINKIFDRIKLLSEITTPQELEKEFPMLFIKYKNKISFYNQVDKIVLELAKCDRKTRKEYKKS